MISPSIISAIICSLPPRGCTVTVRQLLAASAAWLTHIWFHPLDQAYREIRERLQWAYRLSGEGDLDPLETLGVPDRLVPFPEALLTAWADLSDRSVSLLSITLDGPDRGLTLGALTPDVDSFFVF